MDAKHGIALWGDFKENLSDALHVPQGALHVVVGLLLYPLFARWMGVRAGSWRPLLPIAALELVNEGIDFLRYYLSRWPFSPMNSVNDVLLTLGPIALVVLAIRRWRRPAGQMPQ